MKLLGLLVAAVAARVRRDALAPLYRRERVPWRVYSEACRADAGAVLALAEASCLARARRALLAEGVQA